MSKGPEGYKYVRQYRVGPRDRWGHPTVLRWALFEVIGGKARRVGTALSEGEYRAWWSQ